MREVLIVLAAVIPLGIMTWLAVKAPVHHPDDGFHYEDEYE